MNSITDIKNELKVFDRYKFYEEPHIYTYVEDDGTETEVGMSVTQLISQYENPFDEEKMSYFTAKKKGIPQEMVLANWHFNRDFSCCKGTHIHAYNEYLWKYQGKRPYKYNRDDVIDEFGYDAIENVWEKIKLLCERFYAQFKDHLIPIGLEQIVGSRDYDIAGAIDFLAYSKKLDAIIILDYKTNKEIKKGSYNNKKMLKPLNDILDCNYYHYCLQLAIYKILIEHETNLKLSNKKWLIWLNENNDNYVLYECEDLEDKAREILEKRRVKWK